MAKILLVLAVISAVVLGESVTLNVKENKNSKKQVATENDSDTSSTHRKSRSITESIPISLHYDDQNKIPALSHLLQRSTQDDGDSLIPMIRFGRSSHYKRDSLIPTIRFGRSGYSSSISTIPNIRYGRSREDSVIPSIRFGRSSDSMLPTLRFGRSGSSENDSVIPQIRFGKSLQKFESHPQLVYENGKMKSWNSENYGYSAADDSGEQRYDDTGAEIESEQENQGLSYIFGEEKNGSGGKIGTSKRGMAILPFTRQNQMAGVVPISHAVKENPELSGQPKTKTINMEDYDSQFVIPYPRPGKRSLNYYTPRNRNKDRYSEENLDNDVSYVLPYPRPGKRNKRDSEPSDDVFLIPFPRPGRAALSHSTWTSSQINKPSINSKMNYSHSKRDKNNESFHPKTKLRRSEEHEYHIIPFPRLGRSEYSFVLPYPRVGRSSAHKNQNRLPNSKFESLVLPYPRPGRSDSLLPTLRFG